MGSLLIPHVVIAGTEKEVLGHLSVGECLVQSVLLSLVSNS